MKILRTSVMTSREWFKERDQAEWNAPKRQVYKWDGYTCVYCQLTAYNFIQVNHIGAEDDHSLANLETICKPCHSVLIGLQQGLAAAIQHYVIRIP